MLECIGFPAWRVVFELEYQVVETFHYLILTFKVKTLLSSFILRYKSIYKKVSVLTIRKTPYWQYTDLFIFRFVSLLCLRSTLRLFYFRDQSVYSQTIP